MLSFNDFFPPNVIAFISGREFDFTLAKDQEDLSEHQKEQLAQQFSFSLPNIINVRQVHGNKVVHVTEKYIQKNSEIEEADGLITNLLNVPIVVRTADCLPIFMYDTAHNGIGIVHAGWKGTQKAIMVEALRLMNKYWKSTPQDIKIAIGPAIRSCCYKVGEEFKKYFPRETVYKVDGFYLDLTLVNKNQLLKLGVKEKNIFDSRICTHCQKEYFSFRREGEKAGRMISLMMLKS